MRARVRAVGGAPCVRTAHVCAYVRAHTRAGFRACARVRMKVVGECACVRVCVRARLFDAGEQAPLLGPGQGRQAPHHRQPAQQPCPPPLSSAGTAALPPAPIISRHSCPAPRPYHQPALGRTGMGGRGGGTGGSRTLWAWVGQNRQGQEGRGGGGWDSLSWPMPPSTPPPLFCPNSYPIFVALSPRCRIAAHWRRQGLDTAEAPRINSRRRMRARRAGEGPVTTLFETRTARRHTQTRMHAHGHAHTNTH